MCIYIYIYIHIYIYICNHENNVPSRLSCAQVHELPKSYCGDNREGIVFMITYILCSSCLCEISALCILFTTE